MKTILSVIAYLCVWTSSAISGTVSYERPPANPPTNEREFAEAAERVVESSMPAHEKILQLEEIRTEILLLRKKKAEKDGISKASDSPEKPPRGVESRSEKPQVPVPETRSRETTETGTPLSMVHRLVFTILRIAGYAIALGSIAALVFAISGVMDRFAFFLKRQWNARRTFRKSPAGTIPKDGAVPSDFR